MRPARTSCWRWNVSDAGKTPRRSAIKPAGKPAGPCVTSRRNASPLVILTILKMSAVRSDSKMIFCQTAKDLPMGGGGGRSARPPRGQKPTDIAGGQAFPRPLGPGREGDVAARFCGSDEEATAPTLTSRRHRDVLQCLSSDANRTSYVADPGASVDPSRDASGEDTTSYPTRTQPRAPHRHRRAARVRTTDSVRTTRRMHSSPAEQIRCTALG